MAYLIKKATCFGKWWPVVTFGQSLYTTFMALIIQAGDVTAAKACIEGNEQERSASHRS